MEPILRAEKLGKCYRINQDRTRPHYRTLRESVVDLAAAPFRRWRGGGAGGPGEEFWALRDVDFDVQPGEVVGVIGRNGAGKSTLLKILSRITKPTTGAVRLAGRVSSLLEVGTGFHPELTGRENIYLNGAILGMRRAEIRSNFERIVEFAGVERFLDTPVKRYSSGMYVRLAFAVAAHLDPEILLVDEVLAVGDAAFQKKCLGKMQAISDAGRTVLFVSHNMPAVRSLTSTCLYLDGGRVLLRAPTPVVIDRYLADAWQRRDGDPGADLSYYRRNKHGTLPTRLTRLGFVAPDGSPLTSLTTGQDFVLRCEITSARHHPSACLSFGLANENGERVATFFTRDQGLDFAIRPGSQVIECRVRGLPLAPGRYTATIGINQNPSTTAFDVIVDYPAFHVVHDGVESGALDWPHRPWGCVHWENVAWSVKPS